MKYSMKLHNAPFRNIYNGTKTIELRLFDEKRRLLKVGDFIEFTNIDTDEKMTVKIMGLYHYSSFEELYQFFDKISLGYSDGEIADPKDMEKYYSKEEQAQYGVLGIKIQKISFNSLKKKKR